MKTIDDIVQRLRGEYLEMPGLRLTPGQVQRLCGIDSRVCQSVLDALVNAKFLVTSPDGHYARLTEEHIPQPSTDDRGNRRDMLVARPSERRRARSDVEMRRERASLERRWNEQHQASDDVPFATSRPASTR